MLPRFESFTLPCAKTTFSSKCNDGEQTRIVVRVADGRYFALALNGDGTDRRLLVHGGEIYGPAGAPFGFYRRQPVEGSVRSTAPPNLAPDPLQTIATVQAIDRAYAISLAGTEMLRGYSTYHLQLRPLRDPDLYPLRDLWVDRATSEVVRLTYEQPYNTTHANVDYDFAPVGMPPVWVIAHISATAGHERVSQELRDITFPADEPAEDFETPPSPQP